MSVVDIYTTKRRYATILADPPWPYRGQARRTHSATKRLEYPTMNMDEIRRLPVKRLFADDALLFLWTTNPFLEEAMSVIASWGFTYKTAATWTKPRPTTGTWFLGQTEPLLLAVHGHPLSPDARRIRRRPGIILTTDRLNHSVKPRESYTIIEEIGVAPRIELFARRPRKGWDCWGLEAKDFDRKLERDIRRYL